MTLVSNTTGRKKYALFALGVVLLVLGGIAFFIFSNSFAIRSLGAMACIASAYFVSISNIHMVSMSSRSSASIASSRSKAVVGRTPWILGVLVLSGSAASFVLLYRDGENGYRDIFPVYLFAIVMAVCALVWGYIVAKLMR